MRQREENTKGLSQEDFALTSNRTHLSTLERGLKSPALEKINALATTTMIGIHPLALLTLAYQEKQTQGSLKALHERVVCEVDFLQSSKKIP